MTKSLLLIRQHSEATLLAGAVSLVAPMTETEVVHLVPDATVPSQRSRVIVDAAVHALSERGVATRGAVLQAGRLSVADRLQQLIAESHPDLIVLGARRLGRIGAMLQGSVTQQMLSGCSTMALVVPEDATVFAPPLRHVLVAVGGDDDLDRLKIAATRLPADAEYRLVHVAQRVAMHTVGPQGLYFEVGETSEPELDLVAHALERTGRHVRRTLVTAGPTGSAIAEAARTLDAELVVVGSNRPGPFRTLAATSTARDVLVHAGLPVLFAPVP